MDLRRTFGTFYDEVLSIITRHDPIGIAGVSDEYEPEVDAILPRLSEAESEAAARRIIHEEFVRLFDAEIAGPEFRFDGIAHEIWVSWQRHGAEIEEPYETVCPDCEGARACDTCEGTGKWRGGACPFCGGDGICFHCGGNGFITDWD